MSRPNLAKMVPKQADTKWVSVPIKVRSQFLKEEVKETQEEVTYLKASNSHIRRLIKFINEQFTQEELAAMDFGDANDFCIDDITYIIEKDDNNNETSKFVIVALKDDDDDIGEFVCFYDTKTQEVTVDLNKWVQSHWLELNHPMEDVIYKLGSW